MRNFIGVDLGGTNIRAAIVSEDGTIKCMKKSESHPERGAEAVMETMISLIESLDGYEECEGIGMGIPGPIDTINGKIIVSTNLPKLIGFPIAEYIENHFHKPTYMDNDVKVAALGEAVQGAGKDYPIVYYVTISTGVGGPPRPIWLRHTLQCYGARQGRSVIPGLLLSLFFNPSVLRTPPLYFAVQNTEEEGILDSVAVAVF